MGEVRRTVRASRSLPPSDDGEVEDAKEDTAFFLPFSTAAVLLLLLLLSDGRHRIHAVRFPLVASAPLGVD